MVSDETYEICLPILEDTALEDEDKADKLEELLKKETSLRGLTLENAVLNALWRYREGGGTATSPPPIRQTILRRPSPASWRGAGTPMSGSPRLGVSPLAPPGFVASIPFNRTKSSTASPFGSPRPSPRLAFATPTIPHSPNLNAYEFASDSTPAQEIYGEDQTDNVDWLVGDEALSLGSSMGASSGLNAAAPEFSSTQQTEMTAYEMLRSISGQSCSDAELAAALAMHGYDLGATITAMMESQMNDANMAGVIDETSTPSFSKTATPDARPSTPADQKSGVICKFYLSMGQCLRADCRFSHDLSNHLCKYFLNGNCLAGKTCIFSHDPAQLLSRLNIDGTSTPPSARAPTSLQLQDLTAFPSLQPGTPEQMAILSGAGNYPSVGVTPPPGFKVPGFPIDLPRSRPSSRHQNHKDTNQMAPSLDDTDAFPTLGSASAAKGGKKHHGKRGGHGHHKENFTPSSLADIVKMSPSPAPDTSRPVSRRSARNGSSSNIRNGENSAAAQAILNPKHIPWLETGERANKAYLKARTDAIKHGGLRNKFLQSAAQAWNRNDARAAKALSLRGSSENDLMKRAHREAARELYEDRNKSTANSPELYVDLHGLHAEEAVEYLEGVLLENSKETRPIYAITGTGHHSKNGKDKVGKAVRAFLNEWRYAYREFSVPSDRNNMGGILGIDARSYDKSLAKEETSGKAGASSMSQQQAQDDDDEEGGVDILSQGVEIGEGKVKLLVRREETGEPPKGPAASRR